MPVIYGFLELGSLQMVDRVVGRQESLESTPARNRAPPARSAGHDRNAGKSRQPGRCDQPATVDRGGHAVCLKHHRVVWIEYAQAALPTPAPGRVVPRSN
jgi:hypothetical protein